MYSRTKFKQVRVRFANGRCEWLAALRAQVHNLCTLDAERLMQLMKFFQIVLCTTIMLDAEMANAQICTGTSGEGAELLNVSANAGYVNNIYAVGARLGAAGKKTFAGIRAGVVTYDGSVRNAYLVGADIGAIIRLGAMKKYVLCPGLDYGYQAGPKLYEIDEFIHYQSYHTFSPGMSLGYTIAFGERMTLIPFVGVAFQWSRYEQRTLESRAHDVLHRSTSRVGLALQLHRNFMVRTSIGVPIASPSDPRMLSVGGAFSFASPRTKYASPGR